MRLRERFQNMNKGKKIFVSISTVLGIIAIVGFLLAVIGKTYNYTTLSFVGFILLYLLISCFLEFM